ncbi:helix-turn-helix domain-containing protein [Kitasatospora sp. NPDC056651]|uniref:helix-turn-helix domain-containing protein n=1 Tax=Kitasatospora sp. NPDC056651 TaxID=3345892 RepID=UPI0036A80996
MPSTTSFSSAEAVRREVAVRLREICRDAGFNGRELALRAGWHPSKSSRIINALTAPSDEDIRTWCRLCGAEEQTADLIAATRSADSMYVEWRRLQRGGLTRLQNSYLPLFERTEVFRVYSSSLVPGFLQSRDYATALLSAITRFHGTPDDVERAVEARLARSRIVREGGRRFALLMEESVLRHRIGDADAMRGQLAELSAATELPAVALGIIPAGAAREVWPLETFSVYDGERVEVETLTASLTVTRPREIAHYLDAFEKLSATAVYGDRARALIASARDALG